MQLESPSIVRSPRNRGIVAGVVALATFSGAVVSVLFAVAFDEPEVLLATLALFVVASAATARWTHARGEPEAGSVRMGQPGSLRVERGAVVVTTTSTTRVAQSEIASAFVEVWSSRGQLTLLLRDGTSLRAVVDRPADADALLDDLALAPAQRVLSFELSAVSDPSRRAWLGASIPVLILLSTPFFASLALIALVLPAIRPESILVALFASPPVIGLFAVLRALFRRRVRVGADGIAIQLHGFVPHRAVSAVTAWPDQLVIEGRVPVRLRVGSEGEAKLIADRIEHHRARALLRMPELSPLGRCGRSIADWRDALASLGDDGYRAACTPDELARLVEDPWSAPEVRVAAAVALGDRPEKARVRVTLEAAVEPTLRKALERALLGEIDEPLLARATELHLRSA